MRTFVRELLDFVAPAHRPTPPPTRRYYDAEGIDVVAYSRDMTPEELAERPLRRDVDRERRWIDAPRDWLHTSHPTRRA